MGGQVKVSKQVHGDQGHKQEDPGQPQQRTQASHKEKEARRRQSKPLSENSAERSKQMLKQTEPVSQLLVVLKKLCIRQRFLLRKAMLAKQSND